MREPEKREDVIAQLDALLAESGKPYQTERIHEAVEMATKAHAGQRRRSGVDLSQTGGGLGGAGPKIGGFPAHLVQPAFDHPMAEFAFGP